MRLFDNYAAADNDACRQALINKGVLLLRAARRSAPAVTYMRSDKPDVCVAIVARDAPELLAVTLHALQHHQATSDAQIEIIIVDNASQEPTREFLAKIANATIIRSETNLGFGGACNLAVRHSRAETLLFLNPDVEMMPGCIDVLLETVHANDGAIVGGRLIFPGGRLQEAGALFLDDDQLTHPYLRGTDFPFSPEASFRRPSAYVSGALMMVSRKTFDELKGFDDRFSPAYFEDTDLCVRAWRAGKQVLYEPRAVALHFEHATARKHDDVKALMDRNRRVFRDRHGKWIFSSPAAHSRRPLDVRAFDLPQMKVLMIDDCVPYEYLGAGYPRANKIIRMMVELGYFVSLFPLHRGEDVIEDAYREIPREVEIFGGSFGLSLEEVITARLKYYDAIWVSRPHNIRFITDFFQRAGIGIRDFVKSTIIFDAEALYATRDHVAQFVSGGIATSSDLQAGIENEIAPYHLADQVICVSDHERRIFDDLDVRNTVVLSHATALRPCARQAAGRGEIMFLGAMNHVASPNVDSMLWFAKEVMPQLTKRLGRPTRVTIVGPVTSDVRTLFTALPCDFIGSVDDLDPVLAKARVLVAPTRYSAGVPIKFFEAIARGVPLVMTPLLAQQLGWPEGCGYLSAEWTKPEAFAESISKLYLDTDLWQAVRSEGMDRLAHEHGEDRFRIKLRDICETNRFLYV